MAHSDFQTIDPDGKVVEPSVAFCRDRVRPSGWVFRDLFMDSFIAASTVLIRKSVLDHLGGFDEALYWGDYHLWMRIARHYKIDYTPEVLTKYRQHGGQSTRNLKTDRPDAESVAMLAIKSILELYPEVRKELGETVIRRRMAMLYFDMAYSWLWSGAPANARACLRRAIRLWPSNLTFYSAYLISFLPIQTARALRTAWRRLRAAFSPHGYRPDQYEART
jgi:hypothetical protein